MNFSPVSFCYNGLMILLPVSTIFRIFIFFTAIVAAVLAFMWWPVRKIQSGRQRLVPVSEAEAGSQASTSTSSTDPEAGAAGGGGGGVYPDCPPLPTGKVYEKDRGGGGV